MNLKPPFMDGAPILLPAPALVDRAFTGPLRIVSGRHGSHVYDAEGQILATFHAIDLEHEERAKIAATLIHARSAEKQGGAR